MNIPGTCWNCRGVWLLAPETGICHTLSPWEGRLGFTPAGREWCRAPGSAAQPAEAYEFGLGAASHCLLAKYACFPHSLQPPPQNPTFCHLHFFITSMLMNSWRISDSCFHSFTFADGNILAYLKKRSWRWTLFENLAQKCYAFHLTSPVLFTGGRLEISLNLGHS